jgi:ribosomal protein S18 acetylase RimI-like enzyme
MLFGEGSMSFALLRCHDWRDGEGPGEQGLTTPGELEIGPAREEDFAAVLELWEMARSPYGSTPDNEDVLGRLLERDAGALLVARRGGRVIGTLIAAWDGWRGNLYRLAVASDRRRQGIGLAMVRAGERRLYECGARRVTALVGGEDDEATALWRAAGFEHDHLVARFVKNLRPPPSRRD